MTTARHLETIDLLRARTFATEPGPSDVGSEGPGFHIAVLVGYVDPGDPFAVAGPDADLPAEAEQRRAEHGALLDALDHRWGDSSLFDLTGTQLRAARTAPEEEDIPEPWLRLSATVLWLHLWRVDGRWIGVGLSEFQLLAVVTANDPP
ncbi:hypothetical protein ACFWU3_19860 [Streptomyces sp. NPDC058685]|uniref:hypothetical protein n=1 Tax=Streptomyces sp. NPDC058685 TaxID=3346598 RepID=UPI00364EFC99